jgi:Protein of unknown function (DUF3455)
MAEFVRMQQTSNRSLFWRSTLVNIFSRMSAAVFLCISCAVALPGAARAQDVPEQLRPPDGAKLLLEVHAKGDQIYTCKADGANFAWTLKAPDAELTDKDGKAFGRHFAGPSWEATDSSRVTGKAAASVPSPDPTSIPWLLVKVVDHSGDGVLSHASWIQRVNTKGGKAPASGCTSATADTEVRVAYAADYRFFVPN